ncbi:MAG: redoxin domain-containing protein [Candidatus Eisenbacteria bacterium]|uniref:Redoxin domain-containing protein n=1 Tax=Eiseniibacteriota bacterium TaxID=2212470 RepID=A0A933SG08_UNCEI|nr:redoxin domain-containing protein [Candidatus Eisenbacteria bacterium]
MNRWSTRAVAALLAVLGAFGACGALSLAAAAAPKRPAAASPGKPATVTTALLDSACVRYAALSRFHFEGTTHVEISGGSLPQPQKLDIPFVFAAERPSKLRTEMRNPVMPSEVVSDGDTLWLASATLKQYASQPSPSIVPGVPAADGFLRSLDPMSAYTTVRDDAASIVLGGRDTLHTDAGVVHAARFVVTYKADSTAGAPVMLPRTVWVDEATGLFVRDSLTMLVSHPQAGRLTSVQDTRFVHLDVSGGGPAALYAFTPKPGMRRVSRIGAPEREMPDHTGEPATDFSLAGLDGRKVTLSKLKGKVVILDFWATWCGPCRRWMPIVEKVAKELAPKGVLVYAVNERETKDQVRQYLSKTGVKVPVLFDEEGAVGTAYGAVSIPLTVIVGRDGRIVKSMVGLHSEADLRAALEAAGVR